MDTHRIQVGEYVNEKNSCEARVCMDKEQELLTPRVLHTSLF